MDTRLRLVSIYVDNKSFTLILEILHYAPSQHINFLADCIFTDKSNSLLSFFTKLLF